MWETLSEMTISEKMKALINDNIEDKNVIFESIDKMTELDYCELNMAKDLVQFMSSQLACREHEISAMAAEMAFNGIKKLFMHKNWGVLGSILKEAIDARNKSFDETMGINYNKLINNIKLLHAIQTYVIKELYYNKIEEVFKPEFIEMIKENM